jgi:HAD superfamily hydrolase (TIGR01509 family)
MTFEHGMGMRALGRIQAEAKLKSFLGPDADYTAIRSKRIQLMDAYITENGVDLKPGIRELLAHLHAEGIRCAITSSSPIERIRRYLSFHRLDSEFDALCSGHDVPNGKPAPDIYLHGAASLGLNPEECLALEDAPSGIESAYRAGCHTVIIPDLDQPSAETLSRCFAKADSLADIIDLLQNLC